MRTSDMRSSENVEDGRSVGAGGGGQRFGGGPKIAVGGVGGLILVVLFLALGGNPQALLQGGGGGGTSAPTSGATGRAPSATSPQDPEAILVAKVLGDTEDVWRGLFTKMGRQYQDPRLHLFRDGVDSACGFAGSAVGPFYCPGDNKVYIDLDFFQELATRFKAPGDFAQGYVLAHEVGHHVQNLLGISDKVHQLRQRLSDKEYNDVSVRLELQADYFAGVWAHHAAKRNLLEPGDIDEGLAAAAAVGDDRIQKQARGYVVPDSFTHGSSEQRVRWFKLGFQSGDPMAHDPFKVDKP